MSSVTISPTQLSVPRDSGHHLHRRRLRGNPGPGGWGAVLIAGPHEKELSGAEALTTNNRMELTAAIRALAALKRPCTIHAVHGLAVRPQRHHRMAARNGRRATGAPQTRSR